MLKKLLLAVKILPSEVTFLTPLVCQYNALKVLYSRKEVPFFPKGSAVFQQVVFPLLSMSNPDQLIKISDLNPERFMEPFVIFEVLEVSFEKQI